MQLVEVGLDELEIEQLGRVLLRLFFGLARRLRCACSRSLAARPALLLSPVQVLLRLLEVVLDLLQPAARLALELQSLQALLPLRVRFAEVSDRLAEETQSPRALLRADGVPVLAVVGDRLGSLRS